MKHGIPQSLLRLSVERCDRGELPEEVDMQEKVRDYELKITLLERKVGEFSIWMDPVNKPLAHRAPS